jgi:hypothetical protein
MCDRHRGSLAEIMTESYKTEITVTAMKQKLKLLCKSLEMRGNSNLKLSER